MKRPLWPLSYIGIEAAEYRFAPGSVNPRARGRVRAVASGCMRHARPYANEYAHPTFALDTSHIY